VLECVGAILQLILPSVCYPSGGRPATTISRPSHILLIFSFEQHTPHFLVRAAYSSFSRSSSILLIFSFEQHTSHFLVRAAYFSFSRPTRLEILVLPIARDSYLQNIVYKSYLFFCLGKFNVLCLP